MARTPRDFAKRNPAEQKAILADTWCDVCRQADLGMIRPTELEVDGQIIVQGTCARCGSAIQTIVADERS